MSRLEAGEDSITDVALESEKRRPLTGMEPPGAPPPAMPERGFAGYFVRVGWLHLCLLTCALIFTFPFLWMVETSLRTDEELTDPSWLPAIPSFVQQSPYVRNAPPIVRPLGITTKQWDEILPQLTEIAHDEALRMIPRDSRVNPADYAASASAVIVNTVTPRLPSKVWDAGAGAIAEKFKQLLTPEIVSDALDDRLARLELRGLQIRTYDEHIVNLADAGNLANSMKVESGNADILNKGAATWVAYKFGSPHDQPIVLRFDFDLPCEPAELHKLLISYRNDNSWHREQAELDVPGHHWVGERINYVGQNRPGSWIYQPYGPDDKTFKVRNWVVFKDKQRTKPSEGESPQARAEKRPATLRLIIYPSSTLRAIWGKVQWNYRRAFDQVPFWIYMRNSVILVVLTTAGTLFSSAFVAYAFARLNWPGRSIAFLLLLSTMMLPAQVTMIPSFMIWRELGWYNTLNPLWVPSWAGVAFFIFLMTQHMKTIPRDLEEAARIDGLNAVQTWYYIILPLVKPAAAAVAIMTVQGAWNEFMGPLIYLRDQGKFPLSLGIFGIRADVGAIGALDWTMLMAGNVMMTMPMIIMFLLFQRYFVKGMALSGMKG
jgi:multiple sugar transport system permease protein